MTHLTARNNISIALIILYVPSLILSTFLTIRHGLGRSSGWRFLLTFSLARILAACFQLRTIADPTNVSLYIGEWVLLGIALSPLELISLGFLSRILSSINDKGGRATVVTPRHVRLVQLLNTAGLGLAIGGGVEASENISPSGSVTVSSLTKAAIALFIVSWGFIVIFTVLTWPSISYAEPGEKRLLVTVAATSPFLLVRVVYTAMSVFGGRPRFNPVMGNPWYLLGMALIMELIIVYMFLAVGMTLKKVEKEERGRESSAEMSNKGMVV